jgi:predicted enzyme related to lactoylglutathione lyase
MARVIHFEITADDPERATEFYTNVFGWQIQKWNGPQDYWLATTGPKDTPGIDGAIMRRDPSKPQVVNTIDVTALDDMIASVTANGGSIVAPRMTIPGVGYFAYCQDTEGNTFGMMQNDPKAA